MSIAAERVGVDEARPWAVQRVRRGVIAQTRLPTRGWSTIGDVEQGSSSNRCAVEDGQHNEGVGDAAPRSFVDSFGVTEPAAIFGRWACSANLTQAALITRLAHSAGLDEVQAWATASAMRLTPDGLVRLIRAELTVRELSTSGAAMSPSNLQLRLTRMRALASEHADSSAKATETPRSQAAQPSTPITTRPASEGGSGGAPASWSPWNDERINQGIDKLARERGITSSVLTNVMKSMLLNPSMNHDQRAESLGSTNKAVQSAIHKARAALGGGSDNLRTRLAELIGMPLSAVVARIRPPFDPGLPQRVIEMINPSHREGVAKQMLSVQPGSDRDVTTYRVMEAIFRNGDPFAAAVALADQLHQSPVVLNNSINFLLRSFGGERITMLRTMGFSFEQILSMNPVGNELGKRLDPSLGTYAAAERTARRTKNLPCTREEAAERLLRAGVDRPAPGIAPLTYKAWLALGMVSDRPSSMPADIVQAFQSIKPNISFQAGAAELSRAFKVAQVLLNRDIPRGSNPNLMDRDYRQEINLLLCQTFGLGATRLGSGRLESIPTDFKVSDWPNANELPTPSDRIAPRADQAVEDVTWQELLPLLQRRSKK